jgi:hypothetical protein
VVDPELRAKTVAAMGRCVRNLLDTGAQFLAELRSDAVRSNGGKTAEVALKWATKLKARFISYVTQAS